VITSPTLASLISVDGNPPDDVPTGVHSVCFGKVADFDPPPCQNVTVNAGHWG